MSYDPSDAAYDEFIDQLYKEFRESAIEDDELYDRIVDDFRESRLIDYYSENPLLTKSAREALAEAKTLQDNHPRSALVLAVTAAEIILRDALLSPILYGSFHTESSARIIVNLIASVKNDKVTKGLHQIMATHTGMDIRTFHRTNADKPLWEEMQEVQKKRNFILHQAGSSTADEARQAISIAEALIDDFFVQVIGQLGLHIHDNERICGSRICGGPNP